MHTELDLSLIRLDGGTQLRAETDATVVEKYADAMRKGDLFPDIRVYDDGLHKWLAGGFHRFQARQAAQFSTIGADLREGTLRDAILFAVGENEEHGLPRTNEDKRRAVTKLLEDKIWRAKPDTWLAEQAKVTSRMVGLLRAALYPPPSLNGSMIRDVRRGGTSYPMNVQNIGRPPVRPAAATGYREPDSRPRYLAVAEALNSIQLAHRHLPDPRTAASEIGTFDAEAAYAIAMWWTRFSAELRQRTGRTG